MRYQNKSIIKKASKEQFVKVACAFVDTNRLTAPILESAYSIYLSIPEKCASLLIDAYNSCQSDAGRLGFEVVSANVLADEHLAKKAGVGGMLSGATKALSSGVSPAVKGTMSTLGKGVSRTMTGTMLAAPVMTAVSDMKTPSQNSLHTDSYPTGKLPGLGA